MSHEVRAEIGAYLTEQLDDERDVVGQLWAATETLRQDRDRARSVAVKLDAEVLRYELQTATALLIAEEQLQAHGCACDPNTWDLCGWHQIEVALRGVNP